MAKPTFGSWLTHRCDPPCALMRVAEEQHSRKNMTKKELLLAFEKADEIYLDLLESHDMYKHFSNDMDEHLKKHDCPGVYNDCNLSQ